MKEKLASRGCMVGHVKSPYKVLNAKTSFKSSYRGGRTRSANRAIALAA